MCHKDQCLGGWEYCLYSKAIGTICQRHNLRYHCYADDTQVFVGVMSNEIWVGVSTKFWIGIWQRFPNMVCKVHRRIIYRWYTILQPDWWHAIQDPGLCVEKPPLDYASVLRGTCYCLPSNKFPEIWVRGLVFWKKLKINLFIVYIRRFRLIEGTIHT